MPTPIFSIKTSERFIKLAGMLGSDHAGEAANAASAATKILRESGFTWAALLQPIVSGQAPPQPPPPPPPGDGWRDDVAACQRRPQLFTVWEQTFLQGLPDFPWLSPKQSAILDRLNAKLVAAGGAA